MWNIKNNDPNNRSLTILSHKTLLSEPTDDNHVTTKSYTVSLSENDKKTHNLSTVFNDQGKKFDKNELMNLDSNSVSRNPTSDNELSKNNVDDSIRGAVLLYPTNHWKTTSRYLL